MSVPKALELKRHKAGEGFPRPFSLWLWFCLMIQDMLAPNFRYIHRRRHELGLYG